MPSADARRPALALALPAFGWTFAAVPVVWAFELIRTHLLNVPFMDDYVWLPIYEKIAAGHFTFQDFFLVQMEHRSTLPCLLAWLCHHLKPGDITLHNWITFAQLVIITCNLGWLIRRTCPASRWRWILTALAGWTVFSPAQFSTFLWADCMGLFLPVTFLTGALVIFHARLRPGWKFAACALAATLGTHSFASGALIWILLVPLILWSDALEDGARRRFLAGWSIAFVVIMGFYFHGLVNGTEPPFSYGQGKEAMLGTVDGQVTESPMGRHFLALLKNPMRGLRFVLTFAGSLAGRGHFADLRSSALFFGVALAAISVLGLTIMIRGFRDKPLRSGLLPWIMLALYTPCAGAMVAAGRIWASPGIDGALWNRYTPHAVPMTLSALVLASMLFDFGRRGHVRRAEALLVAQSSLFSGFAFVIAGTWLYGARQMDAWYSSRLRDATSQLVARILPAEGTNAPVTGNLDLAVRYDDLGLLHPPMLRSTRLDQFARWSETVPPEIARLDRVEVRGQGILEASGHAFQPWGKRVADGIFLTFSQPSQEPLIFALGHVTQQPAYVHDVLGIDLQFLHQPSKDFRRSFGSFAIRFPGKSLAPGGEVQAWGFDFERQLVWRIDGGFKVDMAPDGATRLVPDRPASSGRSRVPPGRR
jgi:hypothetical protein